MDENTSVWVIEVNDRCRVGDRWSVYSVHRSEASAKALEQELRTKGEFTWVSIMTLRD